MTEVNRKNITAAALKMIPMMYLREGDRFVAHSKSPSRIVTGTAAMDGAMVAEGRGFRAGNMVQCAPENEYINVYLSGVDYTGWMTDSSKQCNTGLMASEGWYIYVAPKIYARYLEDVKENKRIEAERLKAESQTEEERLRAETKRRLERDLVSLRQQVVDLERVVADMK